MLTLDICGTETSNLVDSTHIADGTCARREGLRQTS